MIARKLGLGLEALLSGPPESSASVPAPAGPPAEKPAEIAVQAAPTEAPVDRIRANPFQPRRLFDEGDLDALAGSIRKSGILQPIVVRPREGLYELVAGERRLRAARLAGLTNVPIVVRETDDKQMLQLALVENIQRRDLNPIEKARAFRDLLGLNGWTQEQAAEALGLSRPTVANFIRLLELPPEVQEAVSRGTISMGHARALLATSNRVLQLRLLKQILSDDLSVRAVEKLVAASGTAQTRAKTLESAPGKDANTADLERRLSQFFGTRVTLRPRAKGGEMIVEWFSTDQFNGLMRKLGV
ncbi:MAG: ParB/RepB/Spo0J family partition protein [Planctomycetes bacterium]|nr:ParB/RepB/Spo0J family partition protein [Planctomycetota bacterium]